MSGIARLLIVMGVGLVVIGLILLFLDRIPGLPLGKLPGDFTWERGNTRIYVPLVTMIVVSIVLTILVNLIIRLFR